MTKKWNGKKYMALFFADDDYQPDSRRETGFNRYRQLLERDFGGFLLCGLLTLAGLLPFLLFLSYAILSSSILFLIPAALIGGAFAGPALYGLFDFFSFPS